METDTNIELRSREVQEIMGRVPSIIERVGISVLLVFVILALSISAFVKYPEHLEFKANSYTINQDKMRKGKVDVVYQLSVGLEEKDKIKRNTEVTVLLGNTSFSGKVSFVSPKYNRYGLFGVYVKIPISREMIPLILQYADNTILTVNVANQTILEKMLAR